RGPDAVERAHQDAVTVEPDAAMAREQPGARIIGAVGGLQRLEVDVAIVGPQRLERRPVQQADVAAVPHDRVLAAQDPFGAGPLPPQRRSARPTPPARPRKARRTRPTPPTPGFPNAACEAAAPLPGRRRRR